MKHGPGRRPKPEYPDLKPMHEAVNRAADRVAAKDRSARRIRLERRIRVLEFELAELRETLHALRAEEPSR
jgi:hypothetical protein